jgi:hypothetical protein
MTCSRNKIFIIIFKYTYQLISLVYFIPKVPSSKMLGERPNRTKICFFLSSIPRKYHAIVQEHFPSLSV